MLKREKRGEKIHSLKRMEREKQVEIYCPIKQTIFFREFEKFHDVCELCGTKL